MKKEINKITNLSILVGLILAGLFSFSLYVFANPPTSPYSAPAPLEPGCSPTDPNCSVQPPVPYTGATSAVDLGNNNFTTTGTIQGNTLKVGTAFTLPISDGTNGQFLRTNGSGVVSWATGSGGVSWGAITGTLSDQTDLQSALDTKQNSLTIGNLTEATSSVLTISGGTGAIIGSGLTVQVKQSSGSVSGYLSSTDWTTFNSKADYSFASNNFSGTGTVTSGGDIVNGTLKILEGTGATYYTIFQGGDQAADITYTLPTTQASGTQVLQNNGSGVLSWATVSGTGDVIGPASATDNAIARYDGTTGKLLQDSLVTIDDLGTLTASEAHFSRVGIGTTTPGSTSANGFTVGSVLEVSSDVSAIYLRRSDNLSGLDIVSEGFSTGNIYFDARINSDAAGFRFRTKTTGTPVDAMTILGSGNVGIGTTSPVDKLDVNGAIHSYAASSSFHTNGDAMFDYANSAGARIQSIGPDNSTYGTFQVSTALGNGGSVLTPLFINSSGNIGIGTINPNQTLTVDGTLGILEGTGATYHTIFQGGDQSADITYTLPIAQASGTQVLQNDGSGVLSWVTAATVVGSDKQIFFNDGGAMGADSRFLFDKNAASLILGASNVASGGYSLAVGASETASADNSVAMGSATTASGISSFALGTSFTNSVASSFAVGFGQKDFAVASGATNVYGTLGIGGTATVDGALKVRENSSAHYSIFQGGNQSGTDITYTLPITQASGTQLLQNDGSGNLSWVTVSSGTAWGAITGTLSDQTDLQSALDAKVVGPGSSTDNAVARYDGITGKLVQNSGVTIDDSNNISTPGSLYLGVANTATGTLQFLSALSTGSITISAGTPSSAYALYLPNAQASGTQVLQNDGSGNLSWVSAATVAGSDKQVIFNDGGGAFGASSNLTYDKITNILSVNGNNGVLQTEGVIRTGTSGLQSGGVYFLNAGNSNYALIQAPGSISSSYNLQLPAAQSVGVQFLQNDGAGNLSWATPGDVTGPGSATDNAIVRYDGTTGKLIQDSNITIDDTGILTIPIGVMQIGAPNGVSGEIHFRNATNTNEINFRAPANITSSYTLLLPPAQSSGTQVLQNDGSGNLSWASVATATGGTGQNWGASSGTPTLSAGTFSLVTPIVDSTTCNDISTQGGIVTAGTCTSDARWKENVVTLDNVLEKINNLRGVYYNLTPDYVKNNPSATSDRQIGVIAQEVEAQFPELVTTNAEGYKSVKYATMTAVLIQAVKELNQKVNQLSLGQVGVPSAGQTGLSINDIQDFFANAGVTIQNGIGVFKEIVADKLTAKTARLEKIEMVDQITGDVYCTWIANGQWTKVKGECASISISALQVVTPAPTPTLSPTSTPTPSPIPSPTPASTPTPTPSPTPTPTPTPKPTITPTPTSKPTITPTPSPTPLSITTPSPTPFLAAMQQPSLVNNIGSGSTSALLQPILSLFKTAQDTIGYGLFYMIGK